MWRKRNEEAIRAYYPMVADGFAELGSAATLSFAIGPNPYIRRGRKKVKLNLMGLLVGESSTTGKSSVIDTELEVIRRATSTLVNADGSAPMWRLDNPAGTESFEAQLQAKCGTAPSYYWFKPEQGLLFVTMDREYGSGIADDLTLLFDGDPIDRVYGKKEKSIHIGSMHVVSLWGATQAVCIEHLKPIHAQQGFLQRLAVAYGLPKHPIPPMPEVTQAMDDEFEEMVNEYAQAFSTLINQPPIEFKLDGDARGLLSAWEADLEDRVAKGSLDGAGAKRGVLIALKLAGINKYDALRIPSTTVITVEEMAAAIREAEVYISGAQMLRDLLSDKPDFARVRYQLQKCRKATVPELLRACHVECDRLDQIRRTLLEMNLIRSNSNTLEWIG